MLRRATKPRSALARRLGGRQRASDRPLGGLRRFPPRGSLSKGRGKESEG
nr:MAG TPA: hypothetical protein [Caudoviricetes sp.]